MLETKYPSPTGKYHFQIAPWEARMSLWIESPALLKAKNDEVIFTFDNPNWSLDSAEWLNEEHVKMTLRRYPGDHTPSSFEVEVDCDAKQATVGRDAIPLDALEKHLESLCQPSQRKIQPAAPGRLASLLSRLRR